MVKFVNVISELLITVYLLSNRFTNRS